MLLAIARDDLSADALDAKLRALDPPVIARIDDDTVVLDLRTVDEADDQKLGDAILSLRGEPLMLRGYPQISQISQT